MCAPKHAPRDPCRVFKHRHCLVEVVERRTVVHVERHRVQRCSRAKKKGGLWAAHQLPAYVDAVNEIRRRPGADAMPVVLITSIGKPGHELVKRLPANVVATQGAVAGAVGREVAAAAELGVLRHATHAVLVTGSTFSEVAMRWRTQSNQSAPVVVRLI